MLETSVSEIHSYPLRPEGFEEPLFPTRESRRAVAEHLLRAPWLVRASEIGKRVGEPVEVRRARDGVEVPGRASAGGDVVENSAAWSRFWIAGGRSAIGGA